MSAVIAEGLNLFGALAPPSIEIRRDVAEDVPWVRADGTLAVHLVINLCTNAYQAMQGTEGVLTIGLRYHENPPLAGEAGARVEFWVSDTGHGMDPVTVERIFEPFFTTRSVGQGTGLGLSVVHGIVESFGATITVDTEPGQGSTFQGIFPRSSTLRPIRGVRQCRSREARKCKTCLSSMTRSMCGMPSNGCSIAPAIPSGRRTMPAGALEELRRCGADVVITDIIMPKINGVEAIDLIRKEFPAVRIIAISGGGNFGISAYQPNAITTSAYLAAAERAGAHLILTKPFESKDLIQAVEQVLGVGHA